jgi:hypothetical protein
MEHLACAYIRQFVCQAPHPTKAAVSADFTRKCGIGGSGMNVMRTPYYCIARA